ncbi:MAG: Ig-like domain-containing protein [Gammaproteobacteria bacterium]|nr:Ig-like domain-containing protein [Gammaproteobacteria bacterium]
MSPPTAQLVTGATVQLRAEVRDQNARVMAGTAVTWASSETSVATVDVTGLVTGVGAGGPVTITATSGGRTGTAQITVLTAVASVEVTPPEATIFVGDSEQLTAVTRDAGRNVLTGRTVTWQSSSSSVAAVDVNGVVTGARGGGPVTITATSEGQSGTAQITVLPPVASVEVTPPEAQLFIGASEQLTAVTTDAEGNVLTGRAVTWQSSNPSVVSVDASGLVTGVNAGGPVTITATSEDQSGAAQITVLSTTDFYALVREFVEYYWNASFTNGNLVYSYIQVFEGYGLFPPLTPCGELVPWNAFYCPANAGVYYHIAFLDSYLEEIGDLAPAFIISHEVGHHVSQLLNWIPGVTMSIKQNELQADCFGGAWVKWISDMDLLETGDLEEAAATLLHIGSPEFTWFNPDLHGTSVQRLFAFATGFDHGPSRCTSTEWLGQFPTPPAEAPARPLGEGALELDSLPAVTPR